MARTGPSGAFATSLANASTNAESSDEGAGGSTCLVISHRMTVSPFEVERIMSRNSPRPQKGKRETHCESRGAARGKSARGPVMPSRRRHIPQRRDGRAPLSSVSNRGEPTPPRRCRVNHASNFRWRCETLELNPKQSRREEVVRDGVAWRPEPRQRISRFANQRDFVTSNCRGRKAPLNAPNIQFGGHLDSAVSFIHSGEH